MATGVPEMFNFNRASGKMDYFGRVINGAARVAATVAPGEIGLIAASKNALSGTTGYKIETRGMFSLKGIADEQEIFTLLPTELAGRMAGFEQARVDATALASPGAMSPGAMSPVSD